MDPSAATFILRLTPAGKGAWSAVVERVKTGEKFRVGDLGELGALIARLASRPNDEEGNASVTTKKGA